ncbi:MAG: DNA translocase FtsK [Actinomycetota bacterium]|nr:DNA translocase FtsK [Actinomycetota bacterium]
MKKKANKPRKTGSKANLAKKENMNVKAAKVSTATEVAVKDEKKQTSVRARVVYGLILIAIALFSFICIFFPQSAGFVGDGINKGLSFLFGIGRFAFPVAFLAWAAIVFLKKEEIRTGLILIGMVILAISVLTIINIHVPTSRMFVEEEIYAKGGIIGASISWLLVTLLGRIVSYVFSAIAILIGLVIAFEEQLSLTFKSVTGKNKAGESGKEESTKLGIVEKAGRKSPERQEIVASPKVYPEIPKPVPTEGKPVEQLQMRMTAGSEGKYKLPPLSILNKTRDKAFSQKTNEERKNAIEQTLRSMDVDARVVKVSKGPTVSLFEVEVGTGEKVRRVTELEQDIAYALGSPDIRIYSPIPGKQAIGIEVPNHVRDTVLLGDVIESLEPIASHNLLTVTVGKDMSGKPVVLDLAQLPHLLLAGSTGAGKSCCINSLICCLLFRCKPDQLKLIMIDPKFVEFTWYEGLPHLLCDVINDPEPASKALAWAVQEMEHRYQKLQHHRVIHIDEYNALAASDKSIEVMPKIVIVIDELGDLMLVARREVETSISRLTAKARAVGIHLLIATQRPSVDVITGVIKNNITARIAFQVASIADSRTILQSKGAEKLLGRGDMLLDPGNITQPIRVQGALIQKKEIELLTGYIREQKYSNDEKIRLDVEEISAESELKSHDPLLMEAAEFVVFAGEASASMLQTHLRVGYARARRLLVELAELGIVGPHEGSKSRKVLVTPEEFKEWENKTS